MVAAGKDKEFDRALQLAIKLDKPPFYACRVWPKVHYCMGGVGINKHAQVVDVLGNPIAGLYAARRSHGRRARREPSRRMRPLPTASSSAASQQTAPSPPSGRLEPPPSRTRTIRNPEHVQRQHPCPRALRFPPSAWLLRPAPRPPPASSRTITRPSPTAPPATRLKNAVAGNALVVPDNQACLACHGSWKDLAEKTKPADPHEPNPHASHHYGENMPARPATPNIRKAACSATTAHAFPFKPMK